MPHMLQKRMFSVLPAALLAALVIGCSPADGETVTLTVYSGRSEELVGPIIEQFRELTGVKVEVRWGGTAEMAATIMEEGDNTRADVFYAQDARALGALRDRFTELPDEILGLTQPRFRADDGKWVGISGRARVMVYSTERLTEDELPESVWGLNGSKMAWTHRLGAHQRLVPGDGDRDAPAMGRGTDQRVAGGHPGQPGQGCTPRIRPR